MKRLYLFLFAILFFMANSFAQGHFVVAFPGNGQDHMNITVVTASIVGVPLELGDEIATFDGSICCGKVILTQSIVLNSPNTFAGLVSSRKDDGQNNGYTVGNDITYKFWDSSKSIEISGIFAEYFNNTGTTIPTPTFSPTADTYFVKLTAAANHTLVSNAGPDQTVNEGNNVALDGSASSDADGNALIFKWTAPSGIILSSTTIDKPTFTAPIVTSDTPYKFSLVVSDGTVFSPADLVEITVKNADHLPYVKIPIKDIFVDQRAPNQTINLKSIFADDDIGDLWSYGVTLNSNAQVVTAIITGFDLILSFSTENTGLSEIEITASTNGKNVKSKFMVEVKIPTGINPIISDQKFMAYPNPTSGKVKITFERIPQNGIYLTVNDVTGKTILKQFIQNKEEWIDLYGNPPGLYLLKTNLNNMMIHKLLLK